MDVPLSSSVLNQMVHEHKSGKTKRQSSNKGKNLYLVGPFGRVSDESFGQKVL